MHRLGFRYDRPVRADEDAEPAAPAASPEETMTNIYGRPVRASMVPPRLRLEDQTVRALIERALAGELVRAA